MVLSMTASWDRPIDSDASDRWNLGYCPHAAKRSGFSGRKAKSKTKEWALDQVVDTVQEKVQKAVEIVEVDGFSCCGFLVLCKEDQCMTPA
jgi:hypothetical protein